MTEKEKSMNERYKVVSNTYKNKPDSMAVTSLVKALCAQFKVTEFAIYADIRKYKLANGIPLRKH